MDNSYRIHTNIGSDTVLNVNLKQDFDFLEVLSLRLRQNDVYKLHSSSYGVIIGRVLANDAFGIPNAKVSVFIERDDNDTSEIETVYPYTEVTSTDKDGRRYNLLPDYSDDDCYRVVGTFPSKRLVLDDDVQLEVYEKYWKYTTVTNNAGDYMIFGVPTGSVQVHVDIDLSDIGILSQKPRDFEYKGFNSTMFDSPTQFKESTNLDNLAQIFSQDKSVFVYPFWGDSENGIAAITRSDVQIQYKFEPTCVFMGAIISDNDGAGIGHKCAPNIDNGMNDQLVGGNGTIEMIRKTTDGLVEEFQIKGNQLIDENGVWCYQIPMNLDYIGTDEYGNIVPTDNPSKGVPTRAQVRFRISKNETGEEGFSRHTAKYLVPMNPIFSEDSIIPRIDVKGSEIEKMYVFGSGTPLHCFRDLYWNNVYSVKNYIPKAQIAHRAVSKNYTALKGANLAQDRNEIPFNKLRIDMPFIYIVVCIVFEIIIDIVWLINTLLCIINHILSVIAFILKTIRRILKATWVLRWLARRIPRIEDKLKVYCIPLSAGLEEGNTAFYPGCSCGKKYMGECPSDMDGKCEKTDDTPELRDRVQRNLANDFKIVKLDFYQDWLNGALYMPLWYWRKRKKRSFLFGLIHSRAKSEFCSCERNYKNLKLYTTCEVPYKDTNLTVHENYPKGNKMKRWHKKMANRVRFMRGIIKPVTNKDGLTAYYYAAIQATSRNEGTEKMAMEDREGGFEAVRLYATDIILLGNLNEENLYGIPQFFKCLPATTANVPPIATIEESNETEDEEVDYNKISDSEASESDESGNTLTTGMDWGNKKNATKTTPQYKKGLFMDLSCTYASTYGKSCVNVERLSELGVSLDMAYKASYSNSSANGVQEGEFDTDGFINKLELDDMENRSMFATLNHIGFIPQPYQQENKFYTTQVYDTNTNYLVPKFKYIYPVDFDGRQDKFMEEYNRDKFLQPLYDEADDSYITFRLGANKTQDNDNDNDDANKDRIRHFYITEDNNKTNKWYQMPLYNNSYYFFFGIKKGSTAIDKFNKMFVSECFKNDKKPFTIDIDKRGRSYCPSMYSKDGMGYGYIRIILEDIVTPYKYTLKDDNGVVVSSGDNMGDEFFVVGGSAQTSTSDVTIIPSSGNDITNMTYVLNVTDGNGKKLTERIVLSRDGIDAEYDVRHLSTRFYDSASTRIDYICNDENEFYGIIDLTSLTIDGYECYITSATPYQYDSSANTYSVCLKGTSQYAPTSDDNNEKEPILSAVTVYAEIGLVESGNTNNYLCDCQNDIAGSQNASNNMKISEAHNSAKVYGGLHELTKMDYEGNEVGVTNAKGKQAYSWRWFVYQPSDFMLTVTQVCPCEAEHEDSDEKCSGCLIRDNMSSSIVSVHNGQNFNTYLNTMPTRFIIGSINDNENAHIGNESKFYKTSVVTSTTDNNICGWYGVHQEDSYQFSSYETVDKNTRIWEDYITMDDDIETPYIKREILRYKFRTMFNLSDAVYNTMDGNSTFVFDRTGGRERVILRNISPNYKNEDEMINWYVFTDENRVSVPNEFPNIVGSNYLDADNKQSGESGPQFNVFWKYPNKLGNYFAGFDNNASYISNTKIDGIHIGIQRQPNFASISPMDNTPKPKGRDVKKQINNFELVHTSGYQQLDGDKKRKVNPWLRALTVDRRIDYDLVILAPTNARTFNLYPSNNGGGGSSSNESQYAAQQMAPRRTIRRSDDEEPIDIEGVYKLYYELSDGTSGTIECNDSHELTQSEVANVPLPPTRTFALMATKVVLGNCENLRRIGESCFASCVNLTSATISDKIQTIGFYAFKNCYGLTTINIPHNVESIGGYAFMGCEGLTSVTIDISGDIGEHAFIGCSNLEEVIIINVRYIGDSAFKGLESLTSVTIRNADDIGKDAFKGCANLRIIYIDDETPPTIGGSAFEGTNKFTVKVPEELEETYKNDRSWSGFSSGICSGADCKPAPAPEPPSPSGGGSEGGPDYTWRCARIFGRIYNGIEMSYDGEYNVINANVERDEETDEIMSATTSQTLEYTYEYSSGNTDAKTHYVVANTHKWEEDVEDTASQIIKRFYNIDINGIDVRNYLWSDFNEDRLKHYTDDIQGYGKGVIQGNGNIYVWHYPSDNDCGYNSDFNRDNVKDGEYPTVRYMDIGNLPPSHTYGMNIDSCSYDMAVGIEDDDTIKAQTEIGEGVSFSINFDNIITFIPPESNNSFGNIEYKYEECLKGYHKFVADKYHLNFRYNMVSSSDFDVFTSAPRIIWVLSENNCVSDGITIMKTANPEIEMGIHGSPILGDGIDILDFGVDKDYHILKAALNIIERCQLYKFTNPKRVKIGQWQPQDIILPNSVISDNMGRREFFRTSKDNEIESLLRSDDNDFENIIFSNDNSSNTLNGCKAFTIGCIRFYLSKDRDYEHLAKRIYTIETSDIFDARDLLIKVLTEEEDESGNTIPKSYVIKQNLTEIDIPEPPEPEPTGETTDNGETTDDGERPIHGTEITQGSNEESGIFDDEPDDEGGGESGNDDTGDTPTTEDVYVYLQVLTFEMYFNCNPETCPVELQNQAFTNYDMMGFTFIFNNGAEQYEIECNEFETAITDNELRLRFILRWTQEMGLLMDDKWSNCSVTLYAKSTTSSSNFVYKINKMTLHHPIDDEKPTEEGISGATVTNTYIEPMCGQ